jgi:hypothetical protein
MEPFAPAAGGRLLVCGRAKISANARFLLKILPNQEDLDEREKKYMAAIVPAFHSSFGDIQFKVPKAKTVATFLRSLLI